MVIYECDMCGKQSNCEQDMHKMSVGGKKEDENLPFGENVECAMVCKECYGRIGDFIRGYKSMMVDEIKKLPEFKAEEKSAEMKAEEDEPVPPLDSCPKCGSGNVSIIHPAYDGGAYVRCAECHYAPQLETWAFTDVMAAKRWNGLERAKR